MELPRPQALEAPKGEGAHPRSLRAARGPRPRNKTTRAKGTLQNLHGANILILQVEKLRPAERKQLASQRWQSPLHLALQVHSVKGVTVMEGQFSRSADGAD